MSSAGDDRPRYDAFLSFAGEDADLAREIAGALRAWSLSVWYSETELKVGDSLLESIDRGLQRSDRGILLLSPSYLHKGWPEYELDTLMRQRIESGKALLPIWHGVTQSEVEDAHPGLAGIYALNTDSGFETVIRGLRQVLVPAAVTLARTSPWEDPLHRFLQGASEATLLSGGTFTLWEAILNFEAHDYPIRINDSTFSRDDLLGHALEALMGDVGARQMSWLRQLGYGKVKDALRRAGVDLSMLAYQELPDPDP